MNFLGVKRSILFSVGFSLGLAICSGFLIYDAARDNGEFAHGYSQSVSVDPGYPGNQDAPAEPFADYAKNKTQTPEETDLMLDLPDQEEFVTKSEDVRHFVTRASLGFGGVDAFDLVAVNFADGLSFSGNAMEEEVAYVPHEPAVYTYGQSVDEAPELASVDPDGIVDTITGAITFHSADVASVGDMLVRLSGVHGPTSDDMCLTASGKKYDCGDWAEAGMRAVVAERDVTCDIFGQTDSESGAKYAKCSLTLRNGKTRDLAEIGLESGILVLPEELETDPYRISQDKARNSGYGVWSGTYKYAKNGKEEA